MGVFYSQKGMGKGTGKKAVGGRSTKNKKVYKNNGKNNLPSKKFWCKSKEVRIQIAVPRHCAVRRKERKLCEWTFERLQEACDKVAMEDISHLSIALEILGKSTELLRRIIAPADGMGRVALSCVCPHCNSFPLEDYIWCGSSGHGDGNHIKKKHCNWWCAACGGQYEW